MNYSDLAALGLDGHIDIARSAGCWWPFRDVVIMTDRPTAIFRDAQTRLHNEHGPALSYADGYFLYAVHGVRVPEHVITDDPATWSTAQILDEENTEVRRVMIERYGWDRFVTDGHLKLVDTQPDPANDGCDIALYDVPEQIYDEADIRIILVTNASPERSGERRRFGITVPASIDDAIEAAAWTFGCEPDDYRKLVRAT